MSLLTRARAPEQQPIAEDSPQEDSPGTRRSHPIRRRVTTALAALLVLFALIGPDRLTSFKAAAFVRIPVEAVVLIPLALVLPRRARRVLAALVGATLGLLTIVKL